MFVGMSVVCICYCIVFIQQFSLNANDIVKPSILSMLALSSAVVACTVCLMYGAAAQESGDEFASGMNLLFDLEKILAAGKV